MSADPSELKRRILIESGLAHLEGDFAEANGDPTWNTQELQRDFEVHAFLAPFVTVTRKSDGVKGALQFRHAPRVYYDFQPTD